MPILLLQRLPLGLEPPPERTSTGLLAQVGVSRAVSALTASLATASLRTASGLYARVATFDPASVPLPPASSGGGYVVTHGGLPEEAVSYSLSLSGDGSIKAPLPKLDVTLRGRVTLPGEVFITVVVQGYGAGYQQTYGPFGAIGYNYSQDAIGWITRASTIDASETDVEDGSPLMPIFESEFLPWEQERDLTSQQQAQAARDKAIQERALKERVAAQRDALQRQLSKPGLTHFQKQLIRTQIKLLDKSGKPEPDRRHVPVQDVIGFALAALPMPFVLGGTLPYAGDFFWATDDTGQAFLGGTLIGVSFQVKGKTPVTVLQELLSPVGWQVVTRFGEIYIGPPEALKESAQTPGILELPEDLLTGISIEAVNPGAASGNGNRQLPRRVTLTGASARKYLPPLPPEPGDADPSDFAQDAGGTLTSESYVLAANRDTGEQGVQSHTTRTMTKADGVLVEEYTRTEGLVPTFVLNRDLAGNYTATTLRMALQEERRTTHGYGAGTDYPRAEVWSRSSARAYLDWLRKDMPSEETEVRQEWHPEGWLVRKITSKTTYDYFTEVIFTAYHEDETETWTPINEQTWHHEVRRFKTSWLIITAQDGEPDEARRGGVNENWSEMTDQGPPRAPQEPEDVDPDRPDVGEGFPYEETLEVVIEPGGRADPVTRSAPWATSLQTSWMDDVIGTIRRARTAQRTRYEVAGPPRVGIGTRIKDFSLSGAGGTIKASITVEEELDVL